VGLQNHPSESSLAVLKALATVRDTSFQQMRMFKLICCSSAAHDQDQPDGFNTSAAPSGPEQDPAGSATGSKKVAIRLEKGFTWDRESLALLCRWKETLKKGTQVVVDSGAFPGHSKTALDEVWFTYKDEARQAYREVFGEKRG
jgi:hypothetical protein